MTETDKGPNDRRSSRRIPVEMWVEQSTSREVYFQRSANLSAGGIYLEHTIPMPRGTEIRLKFTLPDGGLPLEVMGEIVNTGESGADLGMGIRFVGLSDPVRMRIEALIQRTLQEGG